MIKEIPENAKAIYIFAHGAGAGMEHSFMQRMADGFQQHEIGVVRFNFPYMATGRKSPGSPRQSIDAIVEIYNTISADFDLPLFAGGKSYGGRMASHAVAEKLLPEVKGLVYFGFPLHPPGKPDTKRADHLKEITIPMLFLQGDKDKLAQTDLIENVVFDLKCASIEKVLDADHSFKVPKKALMDQEEVYDQLVSRASEWMKNI